MKIAGIFPTKTKQDIRIDLNTEQPLGIAYIMAAAKNVGHNIKLYYRNPTLEEIADSDVLALSLLTKDISIGLEIARKYKQANPNGKIIVGGPHVSGDPNLVLDDCIDFGVIGEGEETFVELLDNLDRPDNVKGIAYKKDGKLIRTERRPRIDLNGVILRPLRDFTFGKKDYSLAYPPTSERTVIPIISSRGCTMGCEFCTSPSVWERKVVYRNPVDVVAEMKELSQDKEKELYLFDEENLFNIPAKAKELFRILEPSIKGMGFNLGSCADIRVMNKEMADLMQRAGYVCIYWGIESVHPQVLAREKKGSNQDKIKNVLDMFAERGIANIGMTMIGFDYEKEEDILRYAKEFPQYNIHQLRLTIVTPFPGTEFERRLKQQGVKFDPNLSKWDTGHLVYDHPTISPERMQELQQHIVNLFYRSPEWDRRMTEMAKNFPRLRQSIDEFRSYISSHL